MNTEMENLIWNPHENRNNSCFVVYVLSKTTKLSFSHFRFIEDDGKMASWVAFPHEVRGGGSIGPLPSTFDTIHPID